MSKSLSFAAWCIFIFFTFFLLSNKSNKYHADNIHGNRILESPRKSKKFPKKITTFESDSNSIVHISASPKILQSENTD